MANKTADVAIIGTGIVGIATAYFLAKNHGVRNIVLIDRDQPMYFTSAQSGENYRNWWPHPSMVALTNRSIDLDGQLIDWADDEREMMLQEPEYRWLAESMPGSIHCRPDGGDHGSWIKMGWAFNEKPEQATWESPLNDNFPEIVLRGAARLNPALKAYYGKLPRSMHHYGGWYTMTDENWPLIGPMGPEGSFMNCAHSGFGTMASCAGGELCAAWVAGGELPEYAADFSFQRYEKEGLMKSLLDSAKGIL